MQKQKNIRLLIILAVLVVATVVTYLLLHSERSASFQNDKQFALEDVSQIDSVTINNGEEVKTLHYINDNWKVNNMYPADPQKLTVLFAILNQVRVRRPAADAEQGIVDSLFNSRGTAVKFYEAGEIVRQFEVAGDQNQNITYFRDEDGAFIVSIPGYRSYLAAIFNMNVSGWRDKLVFDDVSWSNLEKVTISYPSGKGGFIVEPNKGFYRVEGVLATDSTKLLDYLDRVSLLYADEFLERGEVSDTLISSNSVILSISVTDIRNRPFTLDVYKNYPGRQYLALRDSSQWLLLQRSVIDPLIREKGYFEREE